MKSKTSELSGIALDWVVARCSGFYTGETTPERLLSFYSDWRNGGRRSHDSWAKAGPIIEREDISIAAPSLLRGEWRAMIDVGPDTDWIECDGPTPLIAAMRAYVASKLGDEVEIPDELVGETK